MTATALVMQSIYGGKCAVCSTPITKKQVMAYNGQARCIPCARTAKLMLKDPRGLLASVTMAQAGTVTAAPAPTPKVTPKPADLTPKPMPVDETADTVAAAQEVFQGAPEHLRMHLHNLREAAKEAASLGCPKEALFAALVLGRKAGTEQFEALKRKDGATLVGDLLTGGTPKVDKETSTPSAPTTPNAITLDEFAGILNVPVAPAKESGGQPEVPKADEGPRVLDGSQAQLPGGERSDSLPHVTRPAGWRPMGFAVPKPRKAKAPALVVTKDEDLPF